MAGKTSSKKLSSKEKDEILKILKTRFEKNKHRHSKIDWNKLEKKLDEQENKLWSLYQMEETGGEPDVVKYDPKKDQYIFMDCAIESPKGRRSLCYDREALESRKDHPPKDSAMNIAREMGIEMLDEDDYRYLQSLEALDNKTSSWLLTPAPIRKLGGAIFGDFRYGQVFIYHNGASSYYAARGFRGKLEV